MAASRHPDHPEPRPPEPRHAELVARSDDKTPPDGPEAWKIRAIESTNAALELRSELAANRVERAEIKEWMARINGELVAMRTARRAWMAALAVAIAAAFLVGFALARVHGG